MPFAKSTHNGGRQEDWSHSTPVCKIKRVGPCKSLNSPTQLEVRVETLCEGHRTFVSGLVTTHSNLYLCGSGGPPSVLPAHSYTGLNSVPLHRTRLPPLPPTRLYGRSCDGTSTVTTVVPALHFLLPSNARCGVCTHPKRKSNSSRGQEPVDTQDLKWTL